MSADPERGNRSAAAEMAEAAQAAATSSRFERLEQRARRIINGLFWLLATLWLGALAVIAVWEFMQWHR
jgi:cell division septal protein FtsQ